MKTFIYVFTMAYAVSTTMYSMTFDYTMASSVDTIFKREDRILTSQEAFNKLVHVALSFWNSNTKAVMSYIKDEKSSIQSTLQALSFTQEAINLGQALQQSKFLADFENQYLLAAIVLDKIALMSSQLYGKTDAIQFNQEHIIILKAQLTDLLDSLQLIKPKLQSKPLEVATNIALQIAQPELAQTKKLYTALSPIQTIDLYLQKPENKMNKNSMNMYKFIIDSRDDGNSRYRTVLASACMHAVDMHTKTGIDHLKKLVSDTFLNLFMKYDQLFPKNIKSSVGHAVQKYLLGELKKIEQCKNIEQIRQLWNEEPLFDFYMIKFLKYCVLDYFNDHIDLHATIMMQHKNIETYQKDVTAWGKELTDLECTILAVTTNISISVQPQSGIHRSITLYQATPEISSSFIIASHNLQHYQIVVPKKIMIKK